MTNNTEHLPKRGFAVKEAAIYLGVSQDLLNKLRSSGTVNGMTGPNFVKMGTKVLYYKEALDEWLDGFIGANSLAKLSQLRLEGEHGGKKEEQ